MKSAGYSWSHCCYKGKDDGKCMWEKPFEISNAMKEKQLVGNGRGINIDLAPSISNGPRIKNGVPYGYEISIGPVGNKNGFDDYNDAEEEDSVKGWLLSPKHRAVILNEGIWKDIEWKKIGAAAYGPFANVWFSE